MNSFILYSLILETYYERESQGIRLFLEVYFALKYDPMYCV